MICFGSDCFFLAVSDWLVYQAENIISFLILLLSVSYLVGMDQTSQCVRILLREVFEVLLSLEDISICSDPPVILVPVGIVLDIPFSEELP